MIDYITEEVKQLENVVKNIPGFNDPTFSNFKKDVLTMAFYNGKRYFIPRDKSELYTNEMFSLLWLKWSDNKQLVSVPEIKLFESKKDMRKWLRGNRPVIYSIICSIILECPDNPFSKDSIIERVKWSNNNPDNCVEKRRYACRYHPEEVPLSWLKYNFQFIVNKISKSKLLYWFCYKLYAVK
jgi:hypothetical protein